jgi:hypothetical protein
MIMKVSLCLKVPVFNDTGFLGFSSGWIGLVSRFQRISDGLGLDSWFLLGSSRIWIGFSFSGSGSFLLVRI